MGPARIRLVAMAQLLTPRGRHRVPFGVSSRSGVLLVAALQLIVGLTLLGIYEGFKASWLIAPPRPPVRQSGLHVACCRSACCRRQSSRQRAAAHPSSHPASSRAFRDAQTHYFNSSIKEDVPAEASKQLAAGAKRAAGCLACADGHRWQRSAEPACHWAPICAVGPPTTPTRCLASLPLLPMQSGFCSSAPPSTSCFGSARSPASERYLVLLASSQLSPR